MGEDLGDLSLKDLHGLEQKVDAYVGLVREWKVGVWNTSRSWALGWNNSIGLMDLYRIAISRSFHPVFLPSDALFSQKTKGVENLPRKK